jgi:non-heme chloroperoxidase
VSLARHEGRSDVVSDTHYARKDLPDKDQARQRSFDGSRRNVIIGGVAAVAAFGLPMSFIVDQPSLANAQTTQGHEQGENHNMNVIATNDGTKIYFKDWGAGRPIVFSHGWPLTADAWDAQMLFLGERGYRVIAHDRRGHGRSSQPWNGNNMDTYADDLAALIEALDLENATLVGHSTGGGEVARYIGRHGSKRVSKAALIASVPPLMLRTKNNPGGLPMSIFDQIRAGVVADRSQFFKDFSLPFYGYNKPDAKISQGVRESFWLQGMQGSIKGIYDCIKAFSETDFTEDLKRIDVPTLILQGDADQIVPLDDSGRLTAKIVKNATLKVLPGAPHGLCTTHADQVNADLLAFLKA